MSSSIEDLLKSHFSVYEEQADHHCRTELPNIIFDLPLDPYEFKVYSYIKKIAGDKRGCWKSIPNLSKGLNISETKIKDCLKVLASNFELLKNQPLITIIERKKEDGSPDSNLLIINNIWRINGDHNRKNDNFQSGGGGSPNDGGVGRQKMGGGSPGDYKEDPYNKIPKEQYTSLKVSNETISPNGEKREDFSASKEKKKKPKSEYCSLVVETTCKMIEILRKNNPVYRQPEDLDGFFKAVHQMIIIEKQDVGILLRAFEWACSDNEERNNFKGWQSIVCANKRKGKICNPAEIFRGHFSSIHSQMTSKPKKKFAACSDDDKAYQTILGGTKL